MKWNENVNHEEICELIIQLGINFARKETELIVISGDLLFKHNKFRQNKFKNLAPLFNGIMVKRAIKHSYNICHKIII